MWKSLHPFQMSINTLPYTPTDPRNKIKSDSLNWYYTPTYIKMGINIYACIHTLRRKKERHAMTGVSV